MASQQAVRGLPGQERTGSLRHSADGQAGGLPRADRLCSATRVARPCSGEPAQHSLQLGATQMTARWGASPLPWRTAFTALASWMLLAGRWGRGRRGIRAVGGKDPYPPWLALASAEGGWWW